MSLQRAGGAMSIVIAMRALKLKAIAVVVLCESLILVSPAAATCTASLSVTKADNGKLHFSLTGSGSCPNQGDDQTPVILSLKQDNSPFVFAGQCLSSPCSTQYDQFSSCEGEHKW